MTSSSPSSQPSRVYQNHHLDSTRWEVFEPREGDVVVTSAYKAGSTWTQQVLLLLLGGQPESILEIRQLSVWVEARFRRGSKAELAQRLRDVPGRRLLKTHLPLDGLPWYPQVRYLVGGRDPRDVFMSLANHYGSYTDFAYATINEARGGQPECSEPGENEARGGQPECSEPGEDEGPEVRVGEPLPRCPADPRALWREWITRGWFAWESEGYPFWSNMHHTQSYWDHRDQPNFSFVHYNDMLADLEGEVRRMARFLDIDASDERVALTVEATTFANVKRAIADAGPNAEAGPKIFRAGLDSFFHAGTVGRWRELLTDEDLELYEQAKQRVLTPECAAWLERGRAAWT